MKGQWFTPNLHLIPEVGIQQFKSANHSSANCGPTKNLWNSICRKFESLVDFQLAECQNYSPLKDTFKNCQHEISRKLKNILESRNF